MSYSYWIIRYVPNVVRGEFTNIGILCGRDGGDWAVRFDMRAVRNRGRLGPELHELRPWVSWLTRRVDRHSSLEFDGESMSSGWVSHLRARQANLVQLSEGTPIDVSAAQEGVDLLFPHLVEREVAQRRRSLTRRTMRTEIRDALQVMHDLTLDQSLFVQPRVMIGKERGSFDFLTQNDRADLLMNVWAFNVSDVDDLQQQVQASNYVLTRLRSDGAQLQVGPSQSFQVSASVPVHVVYDPPTSEIESQWRNDVFEAAREAWMLNGVSSITLGQFREAESNMALV